MNANRIPTQGVGGNCSASYLLLLGGVEGGGGGGGGGLTDAQIDIVDVWEFPAILRPLRLEWAAIGLRKFVKQFGLNSIGISIGFGICDVIGDVIRYCYCFFWFVAAGGEGSRRLNSMKIDENR